ncbi:MAG: hypothetical protein KBF93_24435 [Leptospiraceae bacterium]|jgi:ethanolamine utilization microcompartment shell protein EutL|nr:hypothetical protein [Leptospiraceae bacterium]
MNRFVKFLFILFIPVLLINCPTHKDNTLRNGLASYMLNCTGGSVSACNSGCNNYCGVPDGNPVKSENVNCITTCQSSCASNCNISTTLLLYLANHPIKK